MIRTNSILTCLSFEESYSKAVRELVFGGLLPQTHRNSPNPAGVTSLSLPKHQVTRIVESHLGSINALQKIRSIEPKGKIAPTALIIVDLGRASESDTAKRVAVQAVRHFLVDCLNGNINESAYEDIFELVLDKKFLKKRMVRGKIISLLKKAVTFVS